MPSVKVVDAASVERTSYHVARPRWAHAYAAPYLFVYLAIGGAYLWARLTWQVPVPAVPVPAVEASAPVGDGNSTAGADGNSTAGAGPTGAAWTLDEAAMFTLVAAALGQALAFLACQWSVHVRAALTCRQVRAHGGASPCQSP
jgi:hypothetical protein